MKILFNFFSFKAKSFIRGLYWLYNLEKASLGKGVKLAYPLKLEGKGKFCLGDGAAIGKGVEIGVGEGGEVSLGKKSELRENILLKVAKGKRFEAGKRFKILEYTKLYVHQDWTIGNDVSIASCCAIASREAGFYGRLQVGSNVNIGDFSIIDVSDDIIVGNDVAIGPRCVIYTHDHNYQENLAIPWHGKPVVKSVKIGNGSWIGSGVTILPGVEIGEGAIIAAGSVVTKSVKERSLVGGIPAKLIKSLGQEKIKEGND